MGTMILPAQNGPDVSLSDIVQGAARAEQELEQALQTYVFREDIRLQELSRTDAVVGEYHVASEISFDSAGRMRDKVLEQTANLKRITATREDFEDIQSAWNLGLSQDMDKYSIRSLGKETVNGFPCHVLELKPKNSSTTQRLFSGKVWVEDRDMTIIKSSGKFSDVRERGKENLFPQFDLYREKIDGHWFPSSITAKDTLEFSTGPVNIRMTVKFESYRKL